MSSQLPGVPPGHKSGYVAIVGQPNVGKSTLLNTLLNLKLAIVSSKPQTTRNRIVGIRSDPDSQIIFLDTPGVHRSNKELNRAMLDIVQRSINDVDLVLYMVDSQEQNWTEDERFTLEVISKARPPKLLVLNKIDMISKPLLLPLIERYTRVAAFEAVIPISAKTREGVEELLTETVRRLPPGPRYYPDDQVADLSERDIAAEIVREQILNLTHQEIPYSSAVLVEAFEELPDRNVTRIHATIHVEKDSQKGILIGKGGQMLRRIGEASRMQLEKMLGGKVFLELFVRVEKNWTKDPRALRRLGLLEK